jgi:hypothetical protein
MGRRRSSCSYLLVYLNLSLTIDLSHYEPYIVLGRWGRWGIKLQLKGTKQHLIWGRSVPGPVGPKSEPETSVEARISTGLKPRSRPGSNRDPDWSQTELSQFCLWLVLEGSQFGAGWTLIWTGLRVFFVLWLSSSTLGFQCLIRGPCSLGLVPND